MMMLLMRQWWLVLLVMTPLLLQLVNCQLANILIVQVVECRTAVVKPVAERGYAITRATIANSSFIDITSHMRHVDPKAFEAITFEYELCSPIVLTRGVLGGYYVIGLVALNSNLCSEFLLCRAAMPKDSTASTAHSLGASSVLNRSIVITSSVSHLHGLADAMLIFTQVKSLIDQLPMLVSAYKHLVAHPQALTWCVAFFPWVKVATVIPDMASLGIECSVLTTLIAMVLSILCFDLGIGYYICYGWHRYKMLVFSPLKDSWVLSSSPTIILVLGRVPHWCTTGKHGLLTLFWCLDFETMDVFAMQWSASFSICLVRVYSVLSFNCSIMVTCGVFCSSADYASMAGRLGSLLRLLLPDDYRDCRASVLLNLHVLLLIFGYHSWVL